MTGKALSRVHIPEWKGRKGPPKFKKTKGAVWGGVSNTISSAKRSPVGRKASAPQIQKGKARSSKKGNKATVVCRAEEKGSSSSGRKEQIGHLETYCQGKKLHTAEHGKKGTGKRSQERSRR